MRNVFGSRIFGGDSPSRSRLVQQYLCFLVKFNERCLRHCYMEDFLHFLLRRWKALVNSRKSTKIRFCCEMWLSNVSAELKSQEHCLSRELSARIISFESSNLFNGLLWLITITHAMISLRCSHSNLGAFVQRHLILRAFSRHHNLDKGISRREKLAKLTSSLIFSGQKRPRRWAGRSRGVEGRTSRGTFENRLATRFGQILD